MLFFQFFAAGYGACWFALKKFPQPPNCSPYTNIEDEDGECFLKAFDRETKKYCNRKIVLCFYTNMHFLYSVSHKAFLAKIRSYKSKSLMTTNVTHKYLLALIENKLTTTFYCVWNRHAWLGYAESFRHIH